jgi:DNA invertase Pin-like site-specific DNA recombinase
MILGNARVSTDGQSLDAQVKQLRAAGAAKVFKETASGAKTDRIQFRCALDQLAKGDVLMVTRSHRFRARRQLFIPEPVRF